MPKTTTTHRGPTAGPWRAVHLPSAAGDYHQIQAAHRLFPGGLIVATVSDDNPGAAEARANARLIAAAPELADAARGALSVIDAAIESMAPGAPYRAELLAITLELIAALDDAGLPVGEDGR